MVHGTERLETTRHYARASLQAYLAWPTPGAKAELLRAMDNVQLAWMELHRAPVMADPNGPEFKLLAQQIIAADQPPRPAPEPEPEPAPEPFFVPLVPLRY